MVFIICLVLWSGTLSFLIFFSLNKVGYLRHGTEPGAALDDEDGSRHYGVPYDVNAAGDPQKHGVEERENQLRRAEGARRPRAAPAQPAEPASSPPAKASEMPRCRSHPRSARAHHLSPPLATLAPPPSRHPASDVPPCRPGITTRSVSVLTTM